jgi:hypothetical protein
MLGTRRRLVPLAGVPAGLDARRRVVLTLLKPELEDVAG